MDALVVAWCLAMMVMMVLGRGCDGGTDLVVGNP
jgi:hypothetical protein